ncbi:MAG: ATP-grasp domain-containing protein [Spirochaetes bacterium]|nr:ATP-grasp domain-containing protein [Spirochaetota bacterium]
MLKVGVVGAGQLCRMFGEEIKNKNLNLLLYAIDPNDNPPAKEFLSQHIKADYKDFDEIIKLGEKVDVITFEIELANFKALELLESQNKKVYPSSFVLKNIQDKFIQYKFLKENSIPVPESIEIKSKEEHDFENEIKDIIKYLGIPLVLKARKDSYDGRGNFILKKEDDIKRSYKYFENKTIMAQKYVNFIFEVSIIGCRWYDGSITLFPLSFNIHGKDYNILDKTFVLNDNLMENFCYENFIYDFCKILSKEESKEIKYFDIKKVKEKAYKIAYDVIKAFNSYGVLTIEMMVEINDNHKNDNINIYVNEIAPRVHNSGHYSIEGCNISQFEAHLRAITWENKKVPFLKKNFVCMLNIYGSKNDSGKFNIIYENNGVEKIIEGTLKVDDNIFVHNYMKTEVRPYRKIGHITILSSPNEDLLNFYERILKIKDKVKIKIL